MQESGILPPGGKYSLALNLYTKRGWSEGRFSCTSKMPIAQEAPVYGLSRDSGFAEDTILYPRLLRNRKSNAQKSEFRAFDYRRLWAEFRAIDFLSYFITAVAFSQYCREQILLLLFLCQGKKGHNQKLPLPRQIDTSTRCTQSAPKMRLGA